MIEASTFFSMLYSDDAPGYIAIWTPDKFTRWFRANDIERAAHVACNLAQLHNVYFGVVLQPESLGTKRRGSTDTTSAIPGVWMEIDVKSDGAHSQDALPASKREAGAFLLDLPLTPTIIVDSGHGLHGYWLFHELWIFSDDAERNQAQSLLRRWQRMIRERGRRHGWHFDNVSDLARVLRPVGTMNRKLDPREVKAVYVDKSARYGIDDFDRYLPTEDETPPRRSTKEAGDYDPVPIWPIMAGCAWLRHCYHDAARLSEPEWYAALSIVGRCVDGERLAHDFSRPHHGYSHEETSRKLEQSVTAAGPRTCRTIAADFDGGRFCATCRYRDKVTSPINIGVPTFTVPGTARNDREPFAVDDHGRWVGVLQNV